MAAWGRFFGVRITEHRTLRCEPRGKVRKDSAEENPVAVGDDVTISLTGPETGVIESVAPRRSAFFRPSKTKESRRQVIAANLDQLAIVTSVVSPALKTGLVDRMLIAAQLGSLRPVILINKIDLGEPDDLSQIVSVYEQIGFRCQTVSASSGVGMAETAEALRGHRTILAGHSGVGKSTLLNALIPGLQLATQDVSKSTNRGQHTTTAMEMYELPQGGFVVDSPGLKVMGLWEVDEDDLPEYYPDFVAHAQDCRFQPCSHVHEPECAVIAAVQRGLISRFRYDNYLQIRTTLDEEL